MSPTHSDDVAAILGHSGGPDDRLLYSQRQELAALQAEHDDLWKRHARQLDRESEWIKENEALRARVAEAERLLSLVQNGACEAAHHPQEDRHRIGEPCPVDARIRAWLHPSAGGG